MPRLAGAQNFHFRPHAFRRLADGEQHPFDRRDRFAIVAEFLKIHCGREGLDCLNALGDVPHE